jgi:hypothetical protein
MALSRRDSAARHEVPGLGFGHFRGPEGAPADEAPSEYPEMAVAPSRLLALGCIFRVNPGLSSHGPLGRRPDPTRSQSLENVQTPSQVLRAWLRSYCPSETKYILRAERVELYNSPFGARIALNRPSEAPCNRVGSGLESDSKSNPWNRK